MSGPLSLRLPPALAEQLAAQLPSLADEVLAAIAREVPAYARPLEGAFGAGVRRGVQMGLSRFLSLAGEEPGDDEDRAAIGRELYAELGRGEARVGRSLDALLGAYRTGARVAWARLAQLGLEAGLPARELVELAAAVFAYIDELSAASAAGFTAEQSALAGDRERRHRTLAQLLLSDVPAWQVEEAATVAGWQPPATLTAVVVPLRAGREVAARWDGRALLAVEDDTAGTALLLLPDVDGPGQRERLERLLAGRPSVVGLPRPWAEARLSVALVRRAPLAEGGGVRRVEDALAALVVGADPLALAELTGRRLAAFADLTDKSRDRLLDTLRSWLAHQGDRQSVAADLAVHPQTVRYRLGLLRDLLGADLDDPRRRFELSLVLHDRPAGSGGRDADDGPARDT
ncbi:MAG TPA: helix-turn-helix domain-containing protein [Mycobacteriales bacterium]|jgi:hypothetical protein|nr:helix-turn-helix domain-containing protein [Mycobacteriales bacterium]